jgi:hypothetical protein
MPVQEVLIMAVTRMLSGVCTAGLIREADPVTRLRWVRPVKEYDTLLLGDLTDAQGRVIQMDDVVELDLLRPRPQPPHCEDWITDWIQRRPRPVRRLEGERRARFLAEHLDQAPSDVLERGTRSLCLVRPKQIWAHFSLDPFSGKYQARLGFILDGVRHPKAQAESGVPVTDLRWRALGRRWLGTTGGTLQLSHQELCVRLGAEEIYLSLGLSRSYQGQTWLLVIGVHCVPDYIVEIDYQHL